MAVCLVIIDNEHVVLVVVCTNFFIRYDCLEITWQKFQRTDAQFRNHTVIVAAIAKALVITSVANNMRVSITIVKVSVTGSASCDL